jgi:hypothetical protein
LVYLLSAFGSVSVLLVRRNNRAAVNNLHQPLSIAPAGAPSTGFLHLGHGELLTARERARASNGTGSAHEDLTATGAEMIRFSNV